MFYRIYALLLLYEKIKTSKLVISCVLVLQTQLNIYEGFQ